MTSTLPTVIYARQSLDRSGDALAVTRQIEDCSDLVTRRRLSECRSPIIDNDTSAAGRKPRPGFEELLRLIESGAVKVVVAWALDRLTRNRRDTVRLIEACQSHGVLIALVRGSDLDMGTPSGRLVADVLASVARAEIETKGDRQRRAVEQAVKDGRRVGGRRCFGYTLGMEEIPEEAEAVRWAYGALLEGCSLASIAREWNRRGFRTPQGNDWGADVMHRCLSKPAYAALRAYKGSVAGEASWVAVVDRGTWEAAQSILQSPSRRTKGGPRALLTGVAVCGVCGGGVIAGGRSKGQSSEVYRCKDRTCFSRGRSDVDRWVSAVIVARLCREDAAKVFAPVLVNTVKLRDEAEALRKRREALADDLDLDDVTLRRRIKAINTRLEEINTSLAQASRHGAVERLVLADDVRAAWDALDRPTQAEVIRTVAEVRIMPPGRGVRTFRPESVEVRFQGS